VIILSPNNNELEQPRALALPDLVQHRVFSITDGSHDRLVIDTAVDESISVWAPVTGTIAVLSLTMAAIFLMRWPAAWDILYRWPHAVGFAIGLTYWAFLRPSWLGLLIAAASVAIAFRPGWPGRTIRLDASTVLRFNRPN
jgi:hypothetical protein